MPNNDFPLLGGDSAVDDDNQVDTSFSLLSGTDTTGLDAALEFYSNQSDQKKTELPVDDPLFGITSKVTSAVGNFTKQAIEQIGSFLFGMMNANANVPPEAIRNYAGEVMVPVDVTKETIANSNKVREEIYQLGINFRNAVEEAIPTREDLKGSFWWDQLPRGFGSTAGFAAGGVAFGPMGSVLLGGLSQAQMMGEEAFEATGDIDKANLAFAWGIPIGATEAIPISRAIERIKGLGVGQKLKLTDIFRKALTGGLEEGSQELGQTIWENLTAQQIWDASRSFDDGIWEGGAVGFITGFTLAGLGNAAAYKYQQTRDKKLKKAEEHIKKIMEGPLKRVRNYTQAAEEILAYKNVFDFGRDPNHSLELDNPAATNAGQENVERNSASAIHETLGELEKMRFNNILDFSFILGRKNYKNFIEGANAVVTDKQYNSPILDIGIDNETLHDVTERIYHRALALASRSEYGKSLAYDLIDPDNEVLRELRRDLLVLTTLGGGDNNFNALRQKYANIIPEAQLDSYVDEAQSIIRDERYSPTIEEGSRLVEDEIGAFANELNEKRIDEIQKAIQDASLPSTEQNIGGSSEERLSRGLAGQPEPLFEPDAEGSAIANTIASETGYAFEGIQRFGKRELYMFTHPVTGSTLSFFPEELTTEQVTKKMEENAAKFKQPLYEAEAYHGSPYSFDKFDMKRIGTGEGAQAYGYGLYFSSKEQVAKWYAEQLGRAPMLIDENLLTSEDKDKLQKAINFERDIDGTTYDYKGVRYLYDKITGIYWKGKEEIISNTEFYRTLNKASQEVIGKDIFNFSGRNLYKVKLWEGKEQNLLNFDEPITKKQFKQIEEAIKKEGIDFKGEIKAENGEDLYYAISAAIKTDEMTRGESQREASAFLNRAGFDGIVYKGATSGETNYVVFDEEAIKIAERRIFESEIPEEATSNLQEQVNNLNLKEPKINKHGYADSKTSIENSKKLDALLPKIPDTDKAVEDENERVEQLIYSFIRKNNLRADDYVWVRDGEFRELGNILDNRFNPGVRNDNHQTFLGNIAADIKNPTEEELNLINKEEKIVDELLDYVLNDFFPTQIKAPATQTLTQPTPTQRNESYGSLLKDFKGSTVRELFSYLKDKGIAIEQIKGIESTLIDLVGDVTVKIEPIAVKDELTGRMLQKRGMYGQTAPGTIGTITINPNITPLEGPNALYRTLVHEAVHAWTADYINKNTPKAKQFRSEIEGLIRDIVHAIDNPTSKSGTMFFDLTDEFGNRDTKIYKSLRPGTQLRKNLDYYLSSPEEFISGIFSGYEPLIAVMYRVKMVEKPNVPAKNAVARFFDKLFEYLSKIFKKAPDDSSINEFRNIIESFFEDIRDTHYHRLGREIPSEAEIREKRIRERAFYIEDEDVTSDEFERNIDDLDALQQDEEDNVENLFDITTIRGFTDFVATLWGITPGEYMQSLKDTSVPAVMSQLEVLNATYGGIVELRFKKLYKDFYNKRFSRSKAVSKSERKKENYEDFKLSLITRKINRAQELSVKPHYSFEILKGSRGGYRFNVVRKPDEFKTPSGNRTNSLRETIMLESFIPTLTEVLGLPENSLQVAYINDFTTYNVYENNNSKKQVRSVSLSKLKAVDLGIKKEDATNSSISERLAEVLYKAEDPASNKKFIYLGNFAGRNTLPVLTIDKDLFPKLEDKLAEFYTIYASTIKQAETMAFKPYTAAQRPSNVASLTRAILEDMWYGADFDTYLETGKFESIVAHLDFNAVQKRGTKWIQKRTRAQQDPELLEKALGKNFFNKNLSGIRFDEATREVKIRSAIFNSEAEDVVDINGTQYNTKELLNNKLGTSTTDGASFYIIGEFDVIYHVANGTLKDGAIKNFIMSRPGDRPLFVKHAMHGLHPSDPLAKWMKLNNIGILISDKAAKIGASDITRDENGAPVPSSGHGRYSLTELKDGLGLEDDRTFEIALTNISRHSEYQSLDMFSGTARQMINGTSIIQQNPVFQEIDSEGKLSKGLLRLAESIVKSMNREYDNIKAGEITNIWRDLLENPQSPKQEVAANILNGALHSKSFEELISKVPFLKHHPMFAEHINAKLREPLKRATKMILPGWKAALSPNIGALAEHSQVDTVNNSKNIRWLITSLPVTDPVFEAAVPERRIRELLVSKREENRKKSLGLSMGRKFDIDNANDRLEEIDIQIKQEAASIIEREMKKEQPNIKLVNRLKKGVENNLSFISLSEPKVRTWIRDTIWGKPKVVDGQEDFSQAKGGVFDKTTGRIKEGYVIITQDDAARFGVKPGDRLLIFVTPTDSALSVSSATVAGIIPTRGVHKASDNNKALLNSEWIQSMVSKDFDIDTVTLIPYDQEIWDPEQFHDMLDVLAKVKDAYIKHMKRSLSTKLAQEGIQLQDSEGDQSLDVADLFNDDYRTAYAKAMMGPRKGESKNYSILGETFNFINDAYIANPAGIITTRLYHTALSAVKFKLNNLEIPEFDKNGRIIARQKLNFDVNHSNWFDTHFLHLIMTNHLLDFPNNTSILNYDGDIFGDTGRAKMLAHSWGLDPEVAEDFSMNFIYAFNDMLRFLFGKAFMVASNKATSGNKATIVDILQNIADQRSIFSMLQNGDIDGLIDAYNRFQDNYIQDLKERVRPDEKGAWWKGVLDGNNQKRIYVENILRAIDLNSLDVENYSLFKLINNLNPTRVPIVGLTQREALGTEAHTADEMSLMYPAIRDIIDKVSLPAMEDPARRKEYFLNKETKEFYPTYDLTTTKGNEAVSPDTAAIIMALLPRDYDFAKGRSQQIKVGNNIIHANGPLEQLQRAAVAILNGIDEVSQHGPMSAEEFVNGSARAKSFPRLFGKLLEKTFVQTRGLVIASVLKTKLGDVKISLNPNGNLVITNGEESYTGKEILIGKNDKAIALRELLTKEGGAWESTSNRYVFSQFLRFPGNLSVEETKELTVDYIRENLYENLDEKLGRLDQEVFWLSFMGQLTNQGIKDRAALGLLVGRSEMDPETPYTYRGNIAILELMSQFEPTMTDNFLFIYNSFVSSLALRPDIEDISRAVREGDPDSRILLHEPDLSSIPPADIPRMEFSNVLYAMLRRMKKPSFKFRELRKFKKLLKEKGYNEAFVELKDFLSQAHVTSALNQSGLPIGNIVSDALNLSASQFRQKYDEEYLAPAHRAFEAAEQAAEAELEEIIRLNPSQNKLFELYWLANIIHKSFRRKDKKNRRILNSYRLHEDVAIYDERKVYGFIDPDVPLGTKMVGESVNPGIITKRDLDRTRNMGQPTTLYRLHGVATLAWTKTKALRSALSHKKGVMGTLLSDLEASIASAIKESSRNEMVANEHIKNNHRLVRILDGITGDLDELKLRDSIFKRAENLATRDGVTVVEQAGTEEIAYAYKDKVYDNVHDLIDNHFSELSALEKFVLIQALEYRKLYDIEVRKAVISAIRYLEDSLVDLGDDTSEGASYIRTLLETYRDYLTRIESFRGDYMPHEYPISMYKIAWKKEYTSIVRNSLFAERKKHQNLYRNNKNGDEEIANRTDDDIEKLAESIVEDGWKNVEVAQMSASFIPNFQKRRLFDPDILYNTVDPSVHDNYLGGLFRGLERDLVLADYYLFLKSARDAGERSYVIDLMRWWYANQITNKMLHSVPVAKGKLKKGMEVSFIVERPIDDPEIGKTSAEHRVVGIVESINTKDNTLKLRVDIPRRRFEILQKLSKAKGISEQITAGQFHGKATSDQITTLQDLYEQGYIKDKADFSSMDIEQANQAIIDALNTAYHDPARSGIFPLNQVYTRDLNGNKTQDNVDRYFNRGSAEYFHNLAREQANIRSINDGKFNNITDLLFYKVLQMAGTALTLPSLLYRKTMGYLLMAGLNPLRAFGANFAGALFSNLIESPLKFSAYMYKGFREYMSLRSAQKSGLINKTLGEDQLAVYNALVSAGYMRNNLVNLVMDSLNVKPDQVVGKGNVFKKLWYIAKVFGAGSGYSSYIEELTALEERYIKSQARSDKQTKEYINALLTDEKKEEELEDLLKFAQAKGVLTLKGKVTVTKDNEADIRNALKLVIDPFYLKSQILLAKRKWRAQVEGLIRSNEEYTDKELDEAFKKLDKIAPEDLTLNLAEQHGITRKMALRMMFKVIKEWLYQGFPFGLRVQALAEWIRIPAFYAGYYRSIAMGYRNINDNIAHGLNLIDANNARYGDEDKQLGASSTELGKTAFQLSQYTYRNVRIFARKFDDVIQQNISRSRKEELAQYDTFLKKARAFLSNTYITAEELAKSKEEDYKPKRDLKLTRIFVYRTLIGLVAIQLGVTKIWSGLQYRVDPFSQILFQVMDFFAALGGGDAPDDWDEWAEWAKEALFDLLFMYGAIFKSTGAAALKEENEDVIDVITQGRIDAGFNDLNRIVNSYNLMTGNKLEMTSSERENTWVDPERIFNTAVGVQVFGTTVRSTQDYLYAREFFWKGGIGEIKAYDRPIDEVREFESFEERFGEMLSIPGFFERGFPTGDRIKKIVENF